jgi:predicted DNA binding CopG/RHH family protein
MSDTNDSFEKDLEQLIRLFKKIKDKSRAEQFSHLDPAFAQNLDFIISNYEMVKNNMPKELFSQMGLPFQQMMREFINHLKHELGEDFEEYEGLDEELANEDLVSESSDIGEAGEDIANEIKAIDTRLQKPGLSEDEINNLLDKRHDLLNE